MNTFTKTLLATLALTLGACDAADPADFQDGDVALRPLLGGFSLNTSFIGGHDFSELDLDGKVHKYARLDKICFKSPGKEQYCVVPGKDLIDVTDGMLWAKRGGMTYKGYDFRNSLWYLSVDYDKNGFLDSTIVTTILDAQPNKTVPSGSASPVGYWDYYWAYIPSSASGMITKYLEKGESPVPTCEPDVDTGSLGSIVLADTSIDTSASTHGDVEKVPRSLFIACHSGASGKTPTWGYVHHAVGHKAYESVIRTIRADYCNDGVSWTEPGQHLAVTDVLDISKQYDPGYKMEGLVSFENGWLCLSNPRLANLGDVQAACGISECKPDWVAGDEGSDVLTQLP